LDIDGVLHPSLAMADQYFCRIPLLVEAMTDLDVAVVISSSWRFHHQWGALHRFFTPSIRVKLKAYTGPDGMLVSLRPRITYTNIKPRIGALLTTFALSFQPTVRNESYAMDSEEFLRTKSSNFAPSARF
jgi:hypothetical protein